jgi:hypothetical protein
METIKVKYKVNLGPVTGLLIASLAYAVILDASARYQDYQQKKKLVKVGEALKNLGETVVEINKKNKEKESE